MDEYNCYCCQRRFSCVVTISEEDTPGKKEKRHQEEFRALFGLPTEVLPLGFLMTRTDVLECQVRGQFLCH